MRLHIYLNAAWFISGARGFFSSAVLLLLVVAHRGEKFCQLNEFDGARSERDKIQRQALNVGRSRLKRKKM